MTINVSSACYETTDTQFHTRRVVADDIYAFIVVDNDAEIATMPCAMGTSFNVNTCQCSDLAPGDPRIPPPVFPGIPGMPTEAPTPRT